MLLSLLKGMFCSANDVSNITVSSVTTSRVIVPKANRPYIPVDQRDVVELHGGAVLKAGRVDQYIRNFIGDDDYNYFVNESYHVRSFYGRLLRSDARECSLQAVRDWCRVHDYDEPDSVYDRPSFIADTFGDEAEVWFSRKDPELVYRTAAERLFESVQDETYPYPVNIDVRFYTDHYSIARVDTTVKFCW